jgi:DNA-binding NtrC family response regulator
MKTRVLIVEDDAGMRDTLDAVLRADGYDVSTAQSGAEAVSLVARGSFAIMLLDLQLPDCRGIDLIPAVREADPSMPIIMMTAYGTIKTAVEAIKLGAYDFIQKPFELEEMQRIIHNAVLMQKMPVHGSEFRGTIMLNGVIGSTARMAQIFEIVKRVVNHDVTVLITGESGTGKEVLTRAIHENSPRSDRPFVKINCATVPETLLESELFGHEKGAFTGAVGLKQGRFELAEGGTLFLDEICDTPPSMQAKLLRVLQDKKFERIGGTQTLAADVRIICATNKNIKDEVNAGRFRADLYYRLNVIHLHLPPLRERREDIPALVEFLLRELNNVLGKEYASVSPEVMDCFYAQPWPGNIRELRNVLEKSMLLGEGKTITIEDLPEEMRKAGEQSSVNNTGREKTLEELEKERILDVLARNRWNQSKAAEVLGIHRNTLREKIRKFGLKLPPESE